MKINDIVDLTKGWKGYLGALALIVVGIYLLATGKNIEGLQTLSIGLSLLGIRHKLSYNE
jgi:drug/metabolite transporter (DMT)-like permease